jgi:hypothetical protein
VPLVFVGGAPDKVARVRETLPDAAFPTWVRIAETLRDAKPRQDVVVPSSALAGYATNRMPKKARHSHGLEHGFVDFQRLCPRRNADGPPLQAPPLRSPAHSGK